MIPLALEIMSYSVNYTIIKTAYLSTILKGFK
jgi:hypothetical protein